jgi:hypothetical protein
MGVMRYFKKGLLLGGSGGGAPVDPVTVYYLDHFSVDEAAPVVSPHANDTDGSTSDVSDTGSKVTASSGARQVAGTTTSNTLPREYITTSRARAGGLAMTCQVNQTANASLRVGFRGDKTVTPGTAGAISPVASGAIAIIYDNSVGISLYGDVIPAGQNNKVMIIKRPTAGEFYLWRPAATPTWTLLHVGNINVTSPIFAGWGASNSGASDAWTIDDLEFMQLSQANLISDWGLATNRVASPSNGEVSSAAAGDALLEFSWTPASAEVMNFYFRRTDDDNTMILRCDQAAGTVKVIERNGGVETEKTGGTTTQTWTVATKFRIEMRLVGSSIKVLVANVLKNTATDAYNSSVTGIKVAGFATGVDLAAWPLNGISIAGF